MTGGITVIESTPYESYLGIRLPQEVQIERAMRIIDNELTPPQQEILMAYYFQNKTIIQIAAERGRNKSTIARTLHRAEQKLRRFLQY